MTPGVTEQSPTRVDFYRLSGGDTLQAACLIAGKAYQSGYRVRVFAMEEERLEELDTRLWSFRAAAFVPHARRRDRDPDLPEPVILADDCASPEGAQVLVCLSPPDPACVPAYPRVAELVPPDPEGKAAARRRYAAYREAGYQLQAHDLAVN